MESTSRVNEEMVSHSDPIRCKTKTSKPSFMPVTLESTPNPLMSRARAPGEKGSALPPLSREGP